MDKPVENARQSFAELTVIQAKFTQLLQRNAEEKILQLAHEMFEGEADSAQQNFHTIQEEMNKFNLFFFQNLDKDESLYPEEYKQLANDISILCITNIAEFEQVYELYKSVLKDVDQKHLEHSLQEAINNTRSFAKTFDTEDTDNWNSFQIKEKAKDLGEEFLERTQPLLSQLNRETQNVETQLEDVQNQIGQKPVEDLLQQVNKIANQSAHSLQTLSLKLGDSILEIEKSIIDREREEARALFRKVMQNASNPETLSIAEDIWGEIGSGYEEDKWKKIQLGKSRLQQLTEQ